MQTGAITGYIDVAQVTLYVFWIFFAGLIWYLHREDKREGYPLESEDRAPHKLREGLFGRPDPKTYLLPHGGTKTVPEAWKAGPPEQLKARRLDRNPDSPLVPTGNYGEDLLKIAEWFRSKLPDYERFKVLEQQARDIIAGKNDV